LNAKILFGYIITFGGTCGCTGGFLTFGKVIFHMDANGSYGVPQLSPTIRPQASSGVRTSFSITPINSSCVSKTIGY